MTADSTGSGTEELLQARHQCSTRKAALFLVPALAAVTPRRIASGVETGQRIRDHARCQEQVAQGFPEAAGTIVLFDGDDSALFLDTRRELGGDVLDRECSHAPDLELVEQVRSLHLVEALQDGPHSNDDRASP